MPIYEYVCGECGHELEVMQKISDPAPTICPACNAEALKKQISKVAFRLKGTGWYETDFKDKKKDEKSGDASKTDAKKSDKTDGSDSSAKKSSSDGDSKPKAKKESTSTKSQKSESS